VVVVVVVLLLRVPVLAAAVVGRWSGRQLKHCPVMKVKSGLNSDGVTSRSVQSRPRIANHSVMAWWSGVVGWHEGVLREVVRSLGGI